MEGRVDGYLTRYLTTVMKGDMVVVQATCKVHCILIWIFQEPYFMGILFFVYL